AMDKIAAGTNQVILHPNDTNSALAPGDFYELDIDKGGGGAYRPNISHCNTVQLICQNSYDVLTGKKTGPTDQGVDDLIGKPPTDIYVAPGQYSDASGIHDTSKALAIAPIMDLTTASVDPWGGGGFCPA